MIEAVHKLIDRRARQFDITKLLRILLVYRDLSLASLGMESNTSQDVHIHSRFNFLAVGLETRTTQIFMHTCENKLLDQFLTHTHLSMQYAHWKNTWIQNLLAESISIYKQ